MKSALKARLQIVWQNDDSKRFIPRALKGGPGWRVFDRKIDKFLSDQEILKIEPIRLDELMFH